MYPLEQYRQDALTLEAGPFAAKYGRFFMVHVSSRGAPLDSGLEWSTSTSTVHTVDAPGKEPEGSWAVPVTKRPGNPDADRISVGRARGCDIVLRYSYISNLHAVLIAKDGHHTLEEQGSSNGTRVNGIELGKGESVRLEAGDNLHFGHLDLRYVDAVTFWAQLRSPRPPASSQAFGRVHIPPPSKKD